MTRQKKHETEFSDEMNESDDLIGSCFNLLQIETLDQNLVSLIPSLLMLSTDNLMSTSSSNTNETLEMCIKYLKFLIKYLSLKQSEQYIQEVTNFEADESTNGFFLFDSSLKIKSSNSSYIIDYKNVNILNIVKIMFKFSKDSSSYKILIGYVLSLCDVYLNDDQATFNYNKSSIYLWFTLIKKHFVDDNSIWSSSSQLNLFIDYLYYCLNNILNYTQRNFILFQMNLNSRETEQYVDFNKLLVFICLKNYFVFEELVKKNDLNALNGALDKIYSFLIEYIFSSSLIIENVDLRTLQDINKSNFFQPYFNNELLFLKEDKFDSRLIIQNLNQQLQNKMKCILENLTNESSLAEVFMQAFEDSSNMANVNSSKSSNIFHLNLNLRVSHLLFLTSVSAYKVKSYFCFKLFTFKFSSKI
jgi:hypothetical protein